MIQSRITNERKAIILVAVLFINLILISTHVILKNKKSLFQNVIGVIVSPIQHGFQKSINFIGFQINKYFFLKKQFRHYVELKQKYWNLKAENSYLKRKLKEFSPDMTPQIVHKNYIELDVISVDPNIPLNSVIVNKGSGDGVKKNMVVVNVDGDLVGKIVEPVLPGNAKVNLITSSSGGVGAYIKKNKLEGLLTGSNDKLCDFKYLIENKPVYIGDEVVTSGTDMIFQPFLPIGRVENIEKGGLIQRVSVKPFFVEKPLKKLILLTHEKKN